MGGAFPCSSAWNAVVVGLAIGLQIGGEASLKHVVLLLWLVRNGSIPGIRSSFLDHAAERLLLRKVGGGYAFIHRMLLEHFAARFVEPSVERYAAPQAVPDR